MKTEKIPVKIECWIAQIDRTTNAFKKAFGHLTDKQLNWKPNQETWSVAQNVDHLIVINESYFPILKSFREGTYKTPFLGRIKFIPKLLGKTLLKSVQPDRKKKTKTFKTWKPTADENITDIIKKFEVHQKDLKLQIIQSKNVLMQGTVIASPANKNIVYPLEVAFEVMITHEQRHFEQAKEVLKISSFGKGKMQT